MARRISIPHLALAGHAAPQDATTYEGIVKRHGRERAAVAHVKSKTVARRDLEQLLERQAAELRDYASSAPVGSAKLARERASDLGLERARLLLERDPAAEKDLAGHEDDRVHALVVELAACESQEKLVQVLDARAKAKKVVLPGPGAVVLDGEKARALGVRWGKVELLVDANGAIRGVDLVGDERQNLLHALKKEVPR